MKPVQKDLTILTDYWSEPVDRELRRHWSEMTVEVRYLTKAEGFWKGSSRTDKIRASLLDPDVSDLFLSDGTKFSYALYAHAWELTRLFSEVLKESHLARRIGKWLSPNNHEVLLLRYFYEKAEQWVFLCLFASHLNRIEAGDNSAPIVCLSPIPFDDRVLNYLRNIYRDTVKCARQTFTEVFRAHFRILLKESLRLARRNRPASRQEVVQPLTRKAPSLKTERRKARSVIAVEACLGLEPEKERSDLFWLPESGIENDRIMVYFDRPDRPASEEALNAIERQGWLPSTYPHNCHAGFPAMLRSLLRQLDWKRLFRIIFSVAFAVGETRALRSTAYWCWRRVLQSTLPIVKWKNFFTAHGVLIHSNSSDLGMLHHVHQSMALGWGGGLNLRTEVSFDYGPSLKLGGSLLPFDVFFVWGPYMKSAFMDSDIKRVSTLIACGYPFDHLFRQAHQKGMHLRRELQEAGASKILCFFDTSFSRRSFTSKKDVQDVYKALLAKVVENRFLGLVIKPKNSLNETVLGNSGLEELLTKALNTNRCRLVSHKSAMHWVSPCDTALGSDLTVGYPINSAVIEGALAGVPGIHIDLTKHHEHFFYNEGYRQIVFDDLGEAMEAINRWIRNPSNEPSLGDHSAVIDQIDPFRDGKAGERMGRYIAWLLEGFDRRLRRHDAVRRASRLYAEQYGARHVTFAPGLGQQ